MGPVVSRTWYMYGRKKDGNWLAEPLDSTVSKDDDMVFHMGRFKHKMFRLALGKLDGDVEKIYLYRGWRVAKVVKGEGVIDVIFASVEAHNAWLRCKRSRLGKDFDLQYKLEKADDRTIHFVEIQLPED